ncbi:MAG: type II secretion system protein [Planctomycetota bacterium]
MSTVIGNRSSHRGVARGFTLVELLVVIGIISLLVSILLPTLSRARDSARNIQCANNLRQVGIAFMGYQNDFEGYLPSPKAVGVLGDAAITWEEAIMPYLGLSEEWDPTIPTPIGLDVPHFACPFDTETRGVDDRQHRSYAFNIGRSGVGGTPDFARGSFKPRQIRGRFPDNFDASIALGRIAMIGDNFNDNPNVKEFGTLGRPSGSFRVWWEFHGKPYRSHPNGTYNVLFFDLHQETRPYEEIPSIGEAVNRPDFDYDVPMAP